MEREQEIRILFQKYITKKATAEEVAALFREMEAPENRSLFEELITGYSNDAGDEELPPGLEHCLGEAHRYLMQRLPQKAPTYGYRRLLQRMAAAAAVLIIAVAGFHLLNPQGGDIPTSTVMPGGNRATLTLADGRMIDLSDSQDGIIVGDDRIMYSDGTAVSSQDVRNSESPEDRRSGTQKGSPATPYHALTTPKGGTYQLILHDGTKVWLNAASTLIYPVRFSSDKRTVFLEGEAYFAVDRRQSSVGSKNPFIVHTHDQQTIVLGTEFNISAYRDEDETKTTLVNGSIKISALKGNPSDPSTDQSNPQPTVLEPGQQSILSAAGLQTRRVDINSEIAWKNGQFHFHNTSLKTVLRTLSRWYDIDVDERALPDNRFYGEIPRQVPLSEVLGIITTTSGIEFSLTERKENNERRLVLIRK